MQLILSTFFVSLLFINSLSWAATSCVQAKGSTLYTSTDSKKECVLPDLFGNHQAQTPTEHRPSNLSEFESRLENAEQFASTWALRTEDGSIYAALKRWSLAAGWQLSWEIPVDFPIEIVDSSTGTFEKSVRRVLTALRISDYPPYPCFHENRVVRVVRRIQGNDDECM
jgi:hypothetical protein